MKRRFSMAAALFAALLVICRIMPPALKAEAVRGGALVPNPTGLDISGFSAETLDGGAVDGSVFGKYEVTVLHYFAVWSADCIRELGYMQRLFEEGSPDINVLGILHTDATSMPEAALALMENYGIEYECVLPDSVLAKLVSYMNYIPQTFIISRSGMVIEHFPGLFADYESLKSHVQYWTGPFRPPYTLRFSDGLTGQLLGEKTVRDGGFAQPPEAPVHPGFEFTGWEGTYTDVHASCDITASYRFVGPLPELGDVDVDGRLTVADALMTARCAMQLTEGPSLIMFGDIDGSGGVDMNDALGILRRTLGLTH